MAALGIAATSSPPRGLRAGRYSGKPDPARAGERPKNSLLKGYSGIFYMGGGTRLGNWFSHSWVM